MLQIDDKQLLFETAWEGRLENEDPSTRGSALSPEVRIGKSSWWPGKTLMDKDWQAPSGMISFGMVRFVFSIEALKRQTVDEAHISIALIASGAPNNPIVFDMLPTTTMVERSSTRNFTLSPSLKFTDALTNSAELSLGKMETILNLRQAVPVLATNGIGTGFATWRFAGVKERPLIGNQSVYAILDLPSTYSAIYARIEVEVVYSDSLLGFLGKARTPKKAADQLTQRLV